MEHHRKRRAGLTAAVTGAVIALCAVATPAVAAPLGSAAAPHATAVVQSTGDRQLAEDGRPTGALIARHDGTFQTLTLRHAVEGGGATLEDDFAGEYWGHVEYSAEDVAPPAADGAKWLFGSLSETPDAGISVQGALVRIGSSVTGVDVRTDHGAEPLIVAEGYALASWDRTDTGEPGAELPVTLHLADGTRYDTVLPAP